MDRYVARARKMINLYTLLVGKCNHFKTAYIDGAVILILNLKKWVMLMNTEFIWVKDRGLLVPDFYDMVTDFQFLSEASKFND